MGYQEKLVGVIGDPVDDNPTVVIMQAAFDAAGLPFRYLTMQVKEGDLKTAIDGIKALNFTGIGITMPFKREVIQYLDGVSEAAGIMNAVNCIYYKEGKFFGENTDGKGFMESLKRGGIDVTGKKVLLLGAGGVASAIAVELAQSGAENITIVNRSEKTGKRLADTICNNTKATAEYVPFTAGFCIPEDVDILVNCTPIGFEDPTKKPDINYDSVKSSMTVCDVIPNTAETLFLAEAKKKGCRTFCGLEMLVYQGVLGYEYWTGESPDVEVMLSAIKKEYNIND